MGVIRMAAVSVKGNRPRPVTIPLVIALANHLLKEIHFTEWIDARVKWDPRQWHVSPGMLAKAMVLATFSDMRAPLVHVSSRFAGLDTEYLFGKDGNIDDINEYNIGQMLDRLSEQDCNELYRSMALSVATIYQLIITRLHADTTSVSFYGEYDIDLSRLSEAERSEILKIDRGYNKDGRPQCNQVVVGQIVNEDGIVLASEVMDGHTSDVDWNRKAIDYVRAIQQGMAQAGIFVADSKLVCAEHFTNLMNPESCVEFVSRCPANFAQKLESRLIQQAYAQRDWQELGRYHDGKTASHYQGINFTEPVHGHLTRLLVVQSSSLLGKVEQQIEKERLSLAKLVKDLEKKRFKCIPDVKAEWQRLCSHKNARLFTSAYEIETISTEKWPRGRRSPETRPLGMETSYQIKVTNIAENPSTATVFRQTESCFVLISNVGEVIDDCQLLGIYKGQQIVENSFQLLKEPCLASVIYLKNENRIRALTLLLSTSLLIRSIIQYRMRQGLKEYAEQNPDQPLRAGWGHKPLQAPTFKLLFEYSRNNYYQKIGADEYSFDFDSNDNEFLVCTLLNLMKLTVADLI